MNDASFKEKLLKYVTDREGELIENVKEIVRQPSVSSTGEGVEACCDLIIRKMQSMGIEATKHPVKPFPIITGKVGDDPAKKTVLIYAHYDVQPEGDLALWETPPYDPAVRDGKIYGRGAADNKGPLAAHLSAVQFWLREFGELPVNVKFVFEGCEETGSKGLAEFIAANTELLKADITYSSDGCKNHNDSTVISLGVKGMLSVKLELTTMTRDLHSSYAPVLPNAAWQMVELLNQLKANGRVNIPGFYDDILPLPPREKEIYSKLPDVRENLLRTYGTYPSYPEESGYYAHLNGTPTFNINGLYSGYTGPGEASVIPSKAVARLDIRLVKNQSGEKILESLKEYIRQLGYENVEVTRTGYKPPAKTPIDTPFLPPIEEAVVDIFGGTMIYPNRPSSSPDYVWNEILKTPAIRVRWCDFDADNHAPNEHLSLNNFTRGFRLTATVLKKIGECQ